MKKYICYCLIGFIALGICLLVLINHGKNFALSEGETNPSPVVEPTDEIKTTDVKQLKEYNINIPSKWVEVIDDKNVINAQIDVPNELRINGFRKAVAKKITVQQEPVLDLLEEYYHPYINLEDDWLIQYCGADNMYLNFPVGENTNGISLTCNLRNYISMAYQPQPVLESYNRDKYAVNGDLSNFSLTECDEQLQKLFDAVGITGDIYIVHRALEYQIMEEEAIELYIDGRNAKPDYAWSQKDNSYYCEISQMCNDIPIIPSYLVTAYGDILNAAGHTCIVNQERLVSFNFNDIYDIWYEEEFENLLEFYEILNKYRQCVSLTLQDYNTEITDITMRVIAVNQGNGSYTMLPIWIFYGIWEIDGETGPQAVILNAITGEKL